MDAPLRLPRLGGTRARAARSPRVPALAPEALDFQEELDRLIEEPPPPLLGAGPWLLALLLAALVALACVVQVDVIVAGSGRLAPDAPPLVVQPLERAVLREIRARPGDIVTRGQVLALLDPSFTEADRAALLAQRRLLTAQLARLTAEQAGRAPPLATDPDAALQALLHTQRAALRNARLSAFAAEIAGLSAGIAALSDGAPGTAEQVSIAQEVEALRLRLLEGQIGTRLQALAARATRIQAEQDQRQAQARQEELRAALAARQSERTAFLEDWQRQITEELARLHAELSRVEEQVAKATRLDALMTLVAPADGVVIEVARRSAGSVVREAEALVTLVPLGAPLVAEITLRSADIGRLSGGDPTVVKVDAFPFQRHGPLHGTLRSVAPDSTPRSAEGEAMPGLALHRAVIALGAPQLQHLPEGARPIAGMSVTAEVKVGTRRVIEFFLHPLIRGFQESIREP